MKLPDNFFDYAKKLIYNGILLTQYDKITYLHDINNKNNDVNNELYVFYDNDKYFIIIDKNGFIIDNDVMSEIDQCEQGVCGSIINKYTTSININKSNPAKLFWENNPYIDKDDNKININDYCKIDNDIGIVKYLNKNDYKYKIKVEILYRQNNNNLSLLKPYIKELKSPDISIIKDNNLLERIKKLTPHKPNGFFSGLFTRSSRKIAPEIRVNGGRKILKCNKKSRKSHHRLKRQRFRTRRRHTHRLS